MKRSIALGLFVVTALAVAAFAVRFGTHPTSETAGQGPVQARRTEPAASVTEQARDSVLSPMVQPPQRPLKELSDPRDSGPNQAQRTQTGKPGGVTPPASQRDPVMARRAALQANEERFKAEGGTSDWGRRLEATYLAFRPTAGRIQSVSCRAAVCRVEVTHDTARDAERFVDETEMDPRFRNLMIYWFSTDHENTHRVLFIRPGSSTPSTQR